MIPLVDISATGNYVGGIEMASRDVGFMYVAGHGIPPRVIANARASVIEYFSLPLQEKARHRITRENYRGYIPLGFFNPNDGNGSADAYEGYKLHYDVAAEDDIRERCDLYGPNLWPAKPANFKQDLLHYWRECDRVAMLLLAASADILGVDRAEFLQLFETPLTNMTLLHYPPQAANEDGIGIHAHKDTDALTILAQDPVGGLQVRSRGMEEWIPAEPPGDALTVNIGDLLEMWSGGYLVSTPHRVVKTTGAERYSFPYFAVPRYDTLVAPLRPRQPGFDRDAIQVGEATREVWRTNWQDAQPVSANLDPGTFEI